MIQRKPKSLETQLILNYIQTHGPQRYELIVHDIAGQIPPGTALRYAQRRREISKRQSEDERPEEHRIRAGSRDLAQTRINDLCRTGRLVRWNDNGLWIGLPEHDPSRKANAISAAIHTLDRLLTDAGHLDTCFWRPRSHPWPECDHADHRNFTTTND